MVLELALVDFLMKLQASLTLFAHLILAYFSSSLLHLNLSLSASGRQIAYQVVWHFLSALNFMANRGWHIAYYISPIATPALLAGVGSVAAGGLGIQSITCAESSHACWKFASLSYTEYDLFPLGWPWRFGCNSCLWEIEWLQWLGWWRQSRCCGASRCFPASWLWHWSAW